MPAGDLKMWPNITVDKAEFLGGYERDDDPASRVFESVALNHNDKWDDAVIPTGVPVNT